MTVTAPRSAQTIRFAAGGCPVVAFATADSFGWLRAVLTVHTGPGSSR
jgi:hypothetical protein